MTPIDELNERVDWMRKRAVGTLVDGGVQIHLATIDEPMAPAERATPKEETEEQKRDRILRDHYGPLPRKRVEP